MGRRRSSSVGVTPAPLLPISALWTLFTASGVAFFVIAAVVGCGSFNLSEWAGQGLQAHPLEAGPSEEQAQDWMVWGPGGIV